MSLIDQLAQYWLLITIAAFLAEGVLLFGLWSDYNFNHTHVRLGLRDRLTNYAGLKGETTKEGANGLTLRVEAHEVLLGTLKKIETKNAILVSVIIFVLAISMGSILAPGDYSNHDRVLSVFVFSLIAPLLFAFRGMNQIDQRDYRISGSCSTTLGARYDMQNKLMDDLLRKERAFKFAKVVTRASVFSLSTLIGLNLLLLPVKV